MSSSGILQGSALVREPVGFQNGYWVGAPGAYFAADENAWYLTYRIRRPRGVPPDRGGEARIARSTNLKTWTDIWSRTKDRLDSASIERCALIKSSDGPWLYFISYVDPADGRWCVSVISASKIESLDPAKAKPVFKAAPLGLEGIKDPWITSINGKWHMFLSVALPTRATNDQSHSTLDIFNTGECVSATGLATSSDLKTWDWQGIIFKPDNDGWDKYCRRINSIVPVGPQFFAFYDGSASHAENYEERTGLAVSSDLKFWRSLTPDGPVLTVPQASGCLRYIDAHVRGDDSKLFYEVARADSSHEMRVASLRTKELEKWLLTHAS